MNYTDNLNLKKPAKGEYYDVKDFNDNADIIDETIKNLLDALNNNEYGYLPLTGGEMSGAISFQSGAVLGGDNTAGFKGGYLNAGFDSAAFYVFSKNATNFSGFFIARASDGTNGIDLVGKPDGSLLWDGYDVLTAKGGFINGAELQMLNGAGITGNNNNWTYITGNDSWENGARLGLYGTANNDADRAGAFSLRADDGNGNSLELIGRPDGRLTWAGQSLIRDTGWIDMFGGDTPPTGWLACNGAVVSRTTYKKLFDVIGTKYGVGDGSTTFNLPNLNNGSFAEGSDTVGTVKDAGLPAVGGSVQLKVRGIAVSNSGSNTFYCPPDSSAGTLTSLPLTNTATIYGASATVQPKAVTVKFCIKY